MQMCFIIFTFIYIQQFHKRNVWRGGWTLWHCCILRKFSGYMYARMDGKFHIHDKPGDSLRATE